MRIRCRQGVSIFVVLVIAVFLGAASLRADQVTLRNGDRVTGSIVIKDGSMLVVETLHFGRVTVAWDQVESLTTDMPVYVMLPGETIPVQGTLRASAGQAEIAAAGGARSVGIGDLVAIRNAEQHQVWERLQAPTWFELWAGRATIGLAGAMGNAQTQTFATGLTAARETRTDKTSIYFNAITASALVDGVDAATARAIRGGWAYQTDLTPRFFVNIFNDNEYDRFQSLNLRFVAGAGGGYHAIRSDRTRLDLLAGFDYSHEDFSTPLSRNSAEFYWGNDWEYEMNSMVSFLQAYRMFNNLTEPGDFRVNFDIGAVTRLAQWLTWNLNLSDRYLRNPAPGRETNDIVYSTGLGFTFSR
jgi:hypothetical protein